MNWDIVAGSWKQFKGKVKARWGELTDDQLDVIAGRRDVLAGRIQETYGITKNEAEKQLRRFEAQHKDIAQKKDIEKPFRLLP
ncbi:MAG TPA: CsbD family protein [Rhodocyclaceae bacterium]|nr:CsbD family protein [Rhodocyclaceae bacterium]